MHLAPLSNQLFIPKKLYSGSCVPKELQRLNASFLVRLAPRLDLILGVANRRQ